MEAVLAETQDTLKAELRWLPVSFILSFSELIWKVIQTGI